jgi:hypothetical protein
MSDELVEEINSRVDKIASINKKLLKDKRKILSINKDLIIEIESLRTVKFKYFKELIEYFEEYIDNFFKKIPFWDAIKKNPHISQILKRTILPILCTGYYMLSSRYLRIVDVLVFQIITNLLIIYYSNYYFDTTLTCLFT